MQRIAKNAAVNRSWTYDSMSHFASLVAQVSRGQGCATELYWQNFAAVANALSRFPFGETRRRESKSANAMMSRNILARYHSGKPVGRKIAFALILQADVGFVNHPQPLPAIVTHPSEGLPPTSYDRNRKENRVS